MSLCDKFVHGGCCPYASRCQFAHPVFDFTDLDQHRTPFQNLLHANSTNMKMRLETENPEVEIFSVVKPSKRLSIFESICPSKKSESKNDKSIKSGTQKN